MENEKKVKFYKRKKDWSEYEKDTGYASYRSVIDRYIDDLFLCNNIVDIDDSVYENMNGNCFYYIDENGNYYTEKEYLNDEKYLIYQELCDFYQYYLCNLSNYEVDYLTKLGICLSYSDLLDCDVLCVEHFGTSWDYVSTDIELTENCEESL